MTKGVVHVLEFVEIEGEHREAVTLSQGGVRSIELLLDGPGPLASRLAREVPQWKHVAAAANIRAE